jgi:predicted membrane-bound spermidine synthase
VPAFLSGAAALLFETLWFRQTGLALGNGVWASSLVTSSFMGGLALGSGLAASRGRYLRRPLRAYALLEGTVASTGLAIVLLLPSITPLLVPLFRSLLGQPLALNALRAGLALALMSVPAAAMGATLPLLVAALPADGEFGAALGLLYGWNTLGGVAGALAGEAWLVRALGVRGTALTAALADVLAATAALALARHLPERIATPQPPAADRLPASRILLASALAGGILLALEVVWFRLLLQFLPGTRLAFAIMLAILLAGIGVGGLLAGAWLRRDPEADRWVVIAILACGLATTLTYAVFNPARPGSRLDQLMYLLPLRLVFPGALLSGLVFPLLGRSVQRQLGEASASVGTLTLANTTGALGGSLLAGFVLLPRLGVEGALFLLAAAYGLCAMLAASAPGSALTTARLSWTQRVAAAAFLGTTALFPFGLMRNDLLPLLLRRFAGDGARIAAFREGLTETAAYLRRDWGGEPHDYQLITNGFSMSSSLVYSQRYMKLFVYWPLALTPGARQALLICYGVGNTAKAMTDSPQLASIDVVDISPAILALGSVPFPPPQKAPLDDPRVSVHVEDGRFFLLTTDRRFDLITAEPPPPKNAGVVNLYSREYFALVHDRLAEGGVATYWLPVSQLELQDSKAIIRAFCSAFVDCSLWTGGGGEWMLAGTRGTRGPLTEEAFARQWSDAALAQGLIDVGLDRPETIGSLFIADADFLAALTRDTPALDDDHPGRLSDRLPSVLDPPYRALLDPEQRRERFERSAWIARAWPAALRTASLPYFELQGIFDDAYYGRVHRGETAALARVLSASSLRTLPLLLMQVDPAQRDIASRAMARGIRNPALWFVAGADALSRRDYAVAEKAFQQAQDGGFPNAEPYRALAAEGRKNGRDRMPSITPER